MGVPEIVESDLGPAGPSGDPLEGLRDKMRVNRIPVGIGEHPARRLDPHRSLLDPLPSAPGLEDVDSGGVEIDRSS